MELLGDVASGAGLGARGDELGEKGGELEASLGVGASEGERELIGGTQRSVDRHRTQSAEFLDLLLHLGVGLVRSARRRLYFRLG